MKKDIQDYHHKKRSRYLIYHDVQQNIMSYDKVDRGEKSDEGSTNVEATYSCDKCDQKFNSRQELKEHTDTTH
jgi:hypothetical protein